MKTTLLDSRDSVEVLLEKEGNIPAGHKIARADIKKGEHVYKYGESIGVAKEDIKRGEWVHSHNLRSGLDED